MKCITPIYIKNERASTLQTAWYQIPCGTCYNCLMRRVNGWAFRLQQEYKHADSAHFITLTYDTKHVPITPDGELTLDKSDLQKYWKRVRKEHDNKLYPVKYFACGEYGTKTQRPHYHAIVFNAPIRLLEQKWDKGHIHRGQVNPATIYYTLKYMMKRENKIRKRDALESIGRMKELEFQLMSKGIGENYVSPAIIKWHKAELETRYYLPLDGDQKCPMPRYYRKRIYNTEETERIAKHVQALVETEEPLTEQQKIQIAHDNEFRIKRSKLNNDFL